MRGYHRVVPLVLLLACSTESLEVTFRGGCPTDKLPIALTMVRELMNPLAINPECFIVATDSATSERIGFGQIRALGNSQWELASIYVVTGCRGAGIGTQLCERLIDEHQAAGRRLGELHLLTLEKTEPFYTSLGFRKCVGSAIPSAMAFEVAAGTALCSLLGEKLICMRHAAEKS